MRQQDVEKFQAASSSDSAMAQMSHSNPEYSLIVAANNLSVEIDNEILVVHKVRMLTSLACQSARTK